MKKLSLYIDKLYCLIFRNYIPGSCQLGKGTKLAYSGIGVVIHTEAKVGKYCIIGQNTTIGGRSKSVSAPIIGDNVYIGAGSRILGDITIGDNVVIGANAVVIESLPSRCVAVGIPAKVIKNNICSPRDYF